MPPVTERVKRLRGGTAVPQRSDGVGRSGLNRPAHHPSGTGRAAPRLCLPGTPVGGVQTRSHVHVISSQTGDPGAPGTTDDQPLGGGPSRELNNIIGVVGQVPGHRLGRAPEELGASEKRIG
jgi:hypothetical protein